ncbi:hypothetical protein PPL_01905 [Heterostelium album PN500]|uniref:Uncharacterized protein n=1 Tax=Heterostelium pallidum (strain ATCC 26659 / Pp 5 / PN500) TaxID=670386 RepID=D3B0T8_HETP5|nr:hypothetical protein PPL_01905 [Heterostelium album PN500]EFA84912.1 hypothetical protein PPL_01905 [Heterostelium album PN500]|eukprot:XP_020437022.1 hypothetical protein PPL_01905 [Heterostelium album PN500]
MATDQNMATLLELVDSLPASEGDTKVVLEVILDPLFDIEKIPSAQDNKLSFIKSQKNSLKLKDKESDIFNQIQKLGNSDSDERPLTSSENTSDEPIT